MISTRAEQAKPEEARGLLEELWDELAPKLWPKVTHDLHCRAETFARLLDIDTPEAHLAAAMMLRDKAVPLVLRDSTPIGPCVLYGAYACNAATPALTLIAAIARSLGQ